VKELGPCGDDLTEEDEVEFIVLGLPLYGEMDGDLILVKLDGQVFLFLHHEGYLDAHFGRSLVPTIGELGPQQLPPSHVFLPHLYYVATLEGSLP
jgi:hypothetical protein